MLICRKSFLVTLEVKKHIPLIEISISGAGIKLNSMLDGFQSLVVTFELTKGNTFAIVRNSEVGIDPNCLLEGAYGFFVRFEFMRSTSFPVCVTCMVVARVSGLLK